MPVRISDGDSVWRLRYDLANWYRGADLCIKFALRCSLVNRTPDLQEKLEEFICKKACPQTWGCTYVPGDTFRFVGGSFLLHTIYQRHTCTIEQSLVMNEETWNDGTPLGLVLRYRFLSCGCEQDSRAHIWVCTAFDLWVDFMKTQLLM